MPETFPRPRLVRLSRSHREARQIVLGHGSGGRLSANLLRDMFLPMFSNPVLDRLDDQAVVESVAALAFTTDSFVVGRCSSRAATSDRWRCTAP